MIFKNIARLAIVASVATVSGCVSTTGPMKLKIKDNTDYVFDISNKSFANAVMQTIGEPWSDDIKDAKIKRNKINNSKTWDNAWLVHGFSGLLSSGVSGLGLGMLKGAAVSDRNLNSSFMISYFPVPNGKNPELYAEQAVVKAHADNQDYRSKSEHIDYRYPAPSAIINSRVIDYKSSDCGRKVSYRCQFAFTIKGQYLITGKGAPKGIKPQGYDRYIATVLEESIQGSAYDERDSSRGIAKYEAVRKSATPSKRNDYFFYIPKYLKRPYSLLDPNYFPYYFAKLVD